MEAKYGQIAESTRINEAIYTCFEYLSENDQKKFVKKFENTPHDAVDIMHVFSELILGAYLSASGMRVETECKLGGKTPDWAILDDSFNAIAIVETVYHHLDSGTNEIILKQYALGKRVIGYFPHSNDPDFHRLYSRVQDKAVIYKSLIDKMDIPYIVAVFMDFKASIDVQETAECLTYGDESLFKQYPDLSGVIHFEAAYGGLYLFSYIDNPYAIRKINIPSAYFNLA